MLIYKYRSLQNIEYIYDIACNGFVHCSNYKDLNDPFEGQFLHITGGIGFPITFPLAIPALEKQRKFVNDVYNSKRFKICSFSIKKDDVRLWSYYADSHKGIVIEYDIPDSDSNFVRVEYYDMTKEVTRESLNDEIVKRILSMKSSQWQFEEEIRLFSRKTKYNMKAYISKILLGLRTSEESKGIIRKITNNIPITQMILQDNGLIEGNRI